MRLAAAIILTVGMAIPYTTGATYAHHSFNSEFDNAAAVQVAGVVVSVELINPHSYIYLDVKTRHGAIERWALESPGVTILTRRALSRDVVKPGDELGACGYVAKRDVVPTRSEPGTARAARKLQAAVLTLANGQSIVWQNYRQGKCELDT